MKKIYTIITVLALCMITYSVSAQSVNVNSVHKYEISKANAGTSKYMWVVEKSTDNAAWNTAVLDTDYKVFTSYTNVTPVTIGVFTPGQCEIYIKWLKKSEANLFFRVRVIEADASSDCYDTSVKEKVESITVDENNFKVTLAYAGKVLSTGGTNCAVDGDNTLNFTVTKTGGTFGTTKDVNDQWNFQYEVSIDGGAWTTGTVDMVDGVVEGNNVKLVPVSSTNDVHTLALVYTIPKGNGDYSIKVRIKDARDGYGTIASAGLGVEVETLVHMIPASTEITSD